MNTQDVKRKLTAILSADVEGYSRLMGEDELGTIRTLTAYRDTMTNLILLHRGRVVDAPGDNLGDVVEEKERIYGDGVNIAARLESLCDGGGVCISGAAFENVENKLDLEFEDLGEHEVKNIAKPVRVYRVLSYPGTAAHRVIQAKKAVGKKWRKIAFAIPGALLIVVAVGILWNFYLRPSVPQVDVAPVEKMALPLPDKPSIAVYKKAPDRSPDFLPPHVELAAIYSILDREAEARAEAREVLRLSPDFTLEGRRQRFPYKDLSVLERNIAALRKAGLK